MTNVCLIATDASSFNSLYRGQLEYLAASGLGLTLICGGAQDHVDKLRERQVGKVVDFGFVRPPSPARDLAGLLRLVLYFIRYRYDVVIATTPKAILLGSLAALITRQSRRVVFFQGRVYENMTGIARRFYVFLDKVAIACSNEVLFVSPSLRDVFSKEIVSASRKGRVLGKGSGNGVDLERFNPERFSEAERSSLRSKLGLSADEFVVLVVGRICRDKGCLELVRVVERLEQDSRIRFVLLGRADDTTGMRALERLIALGAIHPGYVNDIAPYLSIANAHLFLTHREGFGNVAIEAAAMGVPTIAFDVVGVQDSVRDGVTGVLVAFGDVEAVVSNLREMKESRERTTCRYASSRKWAMEMFSREQVWEDFAAFYKERPQP